MRRSIRTIILAGLILVSTLSATAQGVIVHKSDGTKIDVPYAELDSITTYKGAVDSEQGDVDPETGISLTQEVDLGLSVKWAGWNVGATSPEGYGGYYAWGETEEKADYSSDTYKYWTDANSDGYDDDNEYVNIGADISGTEYDVARQKWGGSWRMPTHEEIEELVNKCIWTWITYKGINGYKVKGPNGNSIFLPAAGFRDYTSFDDKDSCGGYWSSTMGDISSVHLVEFCSDSFDCESTTVRWTGITVRPVK